MNEKFFALPRAKQKNILNAAYRVFAENSYKKAPMSGIAAAGGISKSLLFHYFGSKRELYLFLWEHAIDCTRRASRAQKVLETDDFFEMLERSLRAKCGLMRRFPYLYLFSLRAYYEQDPEVREAVQRSFTQENLRSERLALERLDTSRLRPDIDPHWMYTEIVCASDGFLMQCCRDGRLDPDEIEQGMARLLALWKTLYGRQGGLGWNTDK